MSSFRYKRKQIFGLVVSIIVVIYLCLCISMHFTVRGTSLTEEDCMLYYIINVNGMKGLGHSIVLIVDGNGCGSVFSFNGMQCSLKESILGKSGIGKMSMGTMTKEETTTFLQTGDLDLDEDQLTDNYDVALFRPITTEEYHGILEQITPYVTAEEQFAVLYERWVLEKDTVKKAEYKQNLEQLGQDESLPLYQIYKNNCDHTARRLISSVDTAMQEYMNQAWRMTPNGNLKAFAKKAEDWGAMTLGEQSLAERILMFLVIF